MDDEMELVTMSDFHMAMFAVSYLLPIWKLYLWYRRDKKGEILMKRSHVIDEMSTSGMRLIPKIDQ